MFRSKVSKASQQFGVAGAVLRPRRGGRGLHGVRGRCSTIGSSGECGEMVGAEVTGKSSVTAVK